jgi:alpha-tubulin suppressor-like RCC1 family protein
VLISGLSYALEISAGRDHTCVVVSRFFFGNQAKCWGRNNFGQLGDGTYPLTNDTPVPVVVTGIPTPASISAGAYHTCSLSTGGSVICWGLNRDSQLGNTQTTFPPDEYFSLEKVFPVGLSSSVIALSAGREHHTCAVTYGGGVKCWGKNDNGQCGVGYISKTVNTPTSAILPTGAAWSISAGN